MTVWVLADLDLQKAFAQADITDEGLLDCLDTIARAIDFLNERGVRHRDVTPGNILWFADGGGVCLGDFGIARLVSADSERRVTAVGSTLFAPPETWDGHSHPTHDLYGLAATYLYLRTGKSARYFEGAIEKGESLDGLGPNESRVLRAALHPDPEKRMKDGAVVWMRLLRKAFDDDRTKTAPVPRAAPPDAPAMTPERQAARQSADQAQELLDRLERLQPPAQLDKLMFLLSMPTHHRPSPMLTHGERCLVFLEWVLSDHGPGPDALGGAMERLR